jgi:hypothetical protein
MATCFDLTTDPSTIFDKAIAVNLEVIAGLASYRTAVIRIATETTDAILAGKKVHWFERSVRNQEMEADPR